MTNGLALAVRVLWEAWRIKRGLMTTVHAMTASQPTVAGSSRMESVLATPWNVSHGGNRCTCGTRRCRHGRQVRIHGFGGIRRQVVSIALKDPEMELNLIDASYDANDLAYMM